MSPKHRISFAAYLLLITTPEFKSQFHIHRLMLRQAIAEGRLRMYHIRQGGAYGSHELYIPAIWLGECKAKKRRTYASRVLIPRRGAPYIMEVCRNKQLMTMEEYIQQKGTVQCSR